MGYRPAGGGGGGPSTYFGDHVLTVAPAGQGAQFGSLQDAIDFAEASLPIDEAVGILLAPGYYDEDVILRRNNTHLNGLAGGLGGIIVKSFTGSDCTLASIAAYNATGNRALLVEDSTGVRQHGVPRTRLYDPLPASFALTPLPGVNNASVQVSQGPGEALVRTGGGSFSYFYVPTVSTPNSFAALVALDPLASIMFAVTGDSPATPFPVGGAADGTYDLYTGTKLRTMSVTNVRFGRRTNVPAWFSGTDGTFDPSTSKYNHDSALYSFRALGAPVPGNRFLDDVLALIGVVTDTAAGAAPNAPNGFFFCYAGNPVFLNTLIGDGCQIHNCGGCLVINSSGFSPLVAFCDTAEPYPAGLGVGPGGFAVLGGSFLGGMYAIGADGYQQMLFGATIMNEFKTEATAATYTTLVNCAILGNLEITNIGPAIQFYMGRYSNPCAGAGSGGFTEVVGFGT